MQNLFQLMADKPTFVSTVISPIIVVVTLSLKLLVVLLKYLKPKNELSATGIIHTNFSKLKQELNYEHTSPEVKSLVQIELKHEQMKMLGIKDRRIHFLVLEIANLMGKSFDIEDYRKSQELLTVGTDGELKYKFGIGDMFEKYLVWFLFWGMTVSTILFISAAVLSFVLSSFVNGFILVIWSLSFIIITSFLIIPTLQKFNAAKRVEAQLEKISVIKKEKQRIEEKNKRKTNVLYRMKKFLNARNLPKK